MKWVKGQSGNPKGRPKGSGLRLTPLLKAELETVPEGQKHTYAELFIKKLMKKAMVEGDMQSLKLIINYVDGLPKQDIALDGESLLPKPIMDVLLNHGNQTDNSNVKED